MTVSAASSITPTFKRVLLATDFSDESQHALDYAKAIVKTSDGELTLMHVAAPEPAIVVSEGGWWNDPLEQQRECEQTEAEAEALRAEGFRVAASCPFGETTEEIDCAVRRGYTDLVVVGTRGYTGMRRLLMGSHAQALAERLTVPLLIVGPKAPPLRSESWHPQRLLCAAGIDERGAHLVVAAYQLACHMDAQVDVAYKDFAVGRKRYSDWTTFKRELVGDLRCQNGDDLHPRVTFLDDPEEDGLVELAESRNSDLLIVEYRHRLLEWASWGADSSIPQLIAVAPCPVLVFPTIRP